MKSYNWLRWIGVLPCAIATYFIAYAAMKLMGTLSLFSSFDWDDRAWVTKVTLPAFASGLSVYSYFKVGEYLAPKHKLTTSIVLAVPMVVYMLLAFCLQFTYRFHWQSLIEVIAGIVGMACAFFEPDKGIYIQYKKDLMYNPKYNLDIELFELTDKQYAAIKRMMGKPDMSMEEALRKVNEARAFKSLRQ